MRQPRQCQPTPLLTPCSLPPPGTSGADMAPSGLPYAFVQPLMPQAVSEWTPLDGHDFGPGNAAGRAILKGLITDHTPRSGATTPS